jgi:hypothetical protein
VTPMLLFGLVELDDRGMSGELHVHDLVFNFLHQAGGVVIQTHLLQVHDLEGAGYFPTIVKPQKDLSERSLS